MTLLWRDVFVPDHVVGSDGFTAEVGGIVEMPLALLCQFRTQVAERDHGRASVTSTYSPTVNRTVYNLVGQAVATESTFWPDEWMLDINGLGIYVSEADTRPRISPVRREAGSDPAVPVPEPGAWTHVRGQLSLADRYEAFHPRADPPRHAVRPWLVHRAVRLDVNGRLRRTRARDVTAIRPVTRHSPWAPVGYLLDLEQAAPTDP